MRAVDGKATPPPELQLAWACQKWNSLPDDGAYLDQDYTLMTRMNALMNIYNAMSTMRSAKGDAIHHLPAAVGKTLAAVQAMGVSMGIGG